MTDAGDGVFLRIRGRLPRVASGVFDGPARAGDLDAYDIRYLSFTYVVGVDGLIDGCCGGCESRSQFH